MSLLLGSGVGGQSARAWYGTPLRRCQLSSAGLRRALLRGTGCDRSIAGSGRTEMESEAQPHNPRETGALGGDLRDLHPRLAVQPVCPSGETQPIASAAKLHAALSKRSLVLRGYLPEAAVQLHLPTCRRLSAAA